MKWLQGVVLGACMATAGTAGLTAGCTLSRTALGTPGDAAALPDAGPFDGGEEEDSAMPPADAGPDARVCSTTELCNLFDDDCDGATDEDACGCEHQESGGHVRQICPAARGYEAWGDCLTLGPGYDLVVLDDPAEATALDAVLAGDEAYIGLSDFETEGAYVWVGTSGGLDLFGAGEPDGDEAENCVTTNDGAWATVPCTESHPFVCEGVVRTSLPSCLATDPCNGVDDDCDGTIDDDAVCGFDTYVFDHHVYYVGTTDLAWFAASAYCAEHGGYQLVTIDHRTEGEVLDGPAPNESWIGLNDLSVDGSWVWESDPTRVVSTGSATTPGAYTNWSDGDPSGANSCVAVYDDEQWSDVACAQMQPFVCERAISPR